MPKNIKGKAKKGLFKRLVRKGMSPKLAGYIKAKAEKSGGACK